MAKYLKINGQVCLDTWRCMFICFCSLFPVTDEGEQDVPYYNRYKGLHREEGKKGQGATAEDDDGAVALDFLQREHGNLAYE